MQEHPPAIFFILLLMLGLLSSGIGAWMIVPKRHSIPRKQKAGMVVLFFVGVPVVFLLLVRYGP